MRDWGNKNKLEDDEETQGGTGRDEGTGIRGRSRGGIEGKREGRV